MDSAKLLDRTRKDLRSVLLSAPRGVPLRLLLSDFKMVLGNELPYRQLGYQRLEDFLRDIPDVVRFGSGPTGEPTCFAVADATTSQIARFVALQKKPKLKRSNAPPLIRKPVYSGFTKRSKFGPSSARPRTSSYSSRVGEKFVGSGSVFMGGPPRQPPNYSGYKGPKGPQRQRVYQQNWPPSFGGSAVSQGYNMRSNSSSYSNSSSHASNSNSSGVSRSLLSNGSANNYSQDSGTGFSPGTGFGGTGFGGTGFGGTGFSRSSSGPVLNQTSGSGMSLSSSGPGSNQNAGTGGFRSSFGSGLTQSSTRSAASMSNGKSSPFADKIGSVAIKCGSSPSPPRTGFYSSMRAASQTAPSCPAMTMLELGDWSSDTSAGEIRSLVSVEGFVGREGAYDIPNQTFKYLLFSSLEGKKPLFPAVMLFFKREAWDVENKSLDFQSIPLGTKLKVYGQPVRQINKKKGIIEPAIKIYHYRYETSSAGFHGGKSSGGGWSPIRYSNTSSSSPPASATTATKAGGMSPPNLDKLIYELLKAMEGGVWGKRLGNELKKMHNIEPPGDILAIATSLPFVESEDLSGDRSNPILRLVAAKDPPQSAQKPAARPMVTFTTEKPALPGTVEFTSSEYFDVYVTYINNPISFYLHRIGEDYSEKLQSMTEAMSDQLSKSKTKPVTAVKETELYGYQWEAGDEGGLWCRVLTSKVSGKMADIYFPDYGNSEQVSVQDLVDLPREFYRLPFQAVHCCLHGCAGVRDEATELFVDHALEKTCVAQIMDSSGSRVAVELIDSDKSGDTTINSIIMLALHPIKTLVPKLPNPGDPRVPVNLTDIDEDGIVTVQLRGHGVSRLQQLMSLINEKYSQKAQAADFVTSVKEGKVYCTQFSADMKFYRVKVKRGISNKLLVEYIDYGNEEEIEIRRLRRPLPDSLFGLPPQAVKCKLHGLPPLTNDSWSEGVTCFVASYLDCEDLYLNTVEPRGVGKGTLPLVKLVISGAGEDGEEDVVLTDLIMQQEFENNVRSNPDNEDDNAPVTTETDERGGDTFTESSIAHPNSVLCTPASFNSILKPSFSSESDTSNSKISASFNSTCQNREITLSSPASSVPITPSSPAFSVPVTPSSPLSSEPMTSSSSSSLSVSSPSSIPKHQTVARNSNIMSPSVLSLSAPTTPLSPSTFSLGSGTSSTGPRTPVSSPPTSTSFFSPPPKGSLSPLGAMTSGMEVASLSSETQAVEVVWVESPHNFVVQLLSNSEPLMEEINSSVSTFDPLPFADVRVGVVCCAPSSLDQRWYRVSLVAATDVASVTVRFLDYGSTEVVDVSVLKSLPTRFMCLPVQAIACTLRAVQPLNGPEWSKEANSWFEERVLYKPFFALEMERDSHHSCITLLDTSGPETIDVRDALKDAGFASF